MGLYGNLYPDGTVKTAAQYLGSLEVSAYFLVNFALPNEPTVVRRFENPEFYEYVFEDGSSLRIDRDSHCLYYGPIYDCYRKQA